MKTSLIGHLGLGNTDIFLYHWQYHGSLSMSEGMGEAHS